jgi:hypothetical protein
MSVTAKGPPYVIGGQDWRLMEEWRSNAKAATLDSGVAEPVVHKPIIPELCPSMEQLGEIVGGEKLEWKKIDVEQAARDWWFDSEFLDGTTVREVLEQESEKARSEQVGGTHYSDLSIQPWDAMRAWFTPAEYASYHIGTVIGYLSRHRRKGGLSDIKKAHHHLSELIRYFEEEEEYE